MCVCRGVQDEWPLLVVVPASLRLVWAEEIERWLPHVRPGEVTVIEGREDRLCDLPDANARRREKLPAITITSYEMMKRLSCAACQKLLQGQAGGGVSGGSLGRSGSGRGRGRGGSAKGKPCCTGPGTFPWGCSSSWIACCLWRVSCDLLAPRAYTLCRSCVCILLTPAASSSEHAAAASTNSADHCMAALPWGVMIIDESHNLRTTNSRQADSPHTEAAVAAGSRVGRLILLSGTPSLSRPYDLYRQIDVLLPGLLGRTKEEFSQRCSAADVKVLNMINAL